MKLPDYEELARQITAATGTLVTTEQALSGSGLVLVGLDTMSQFGPTPEELIVVGFLLLKNCKRVLEERAAVACVDGEYHQEARVASTFIAIKQELVI